MEANNEQDQYIDNAMRAVQNKKQIPEIDFTLHTMEDGTQVSTQERVCKGMYTTIMEDVEAVVFSAVSPSD